MLSHLSRRWRSVATSSAYRRLTRQAVVAPNSVFSNSSTLTQNRWLSDSAGDSNNILNIAVCDDGVAIVTFDDPNQSMNTLTAGLMQEFETTLDAIENDANIKSWVLKSGKPGCFIAGADINMLNAANSEAEVEQIVENGHRLFNRLENCSKPVVAAIDGVCLGGGLEVALACHYRIASTSKKTQLALPEIKLGLLPGGGGTQRLPKIVGLVEALTMATTGGNVVPKKAKRTGLVDQLADPYALEDAAIQAAKGLADGSVKKAGRRKKNLMQRIMEDTPVKNIVFKKTRFVALKSLTHSLCHHSVSFTLNVWLSVSSHKMDGQVALDCGCTDLVVCHSSFV